jgi:NTP pyrophosphatase (non-canonical NTP hydrolase)
MTSESNELSPPVSEMQLIEQVGEWAARNFKDHAPDWGIVEEIGEAAHCVLKHRQKIRGFDSEVYFREKFGDALADAIIYLAHYCFMHKTFFKFNRNLVATPEATDERRIVCHLLQTAGAMFAYAEVGNDEPEGIAEQQVYNLMAQRMASGLEYWAILHGMDLVLIVAATWTKKVSKRDWNKNPKGPTGDQI